MSADCGVPERLRSLLDMQNLYLPTLLMLSKESGRLGQLLKAEPEEQVREEENRKKDAGAMLRHAKDFSDLGLAMCKMHAETIAAACKNKERPLTNKKFAQMLDELFNRLADECRLLHFISLSDAEKRLYLPSEPLFGSEVEDKLASVIGDIAEAGKCLGLRRTTAAVFHLMRVMELGVQKFGEKLGVQNVEQTVWQVILDQVNSQIKKMGKSAESKKYAEISAHLYNVKLSWRNETMHPKATYTEEEAEGIFFAVRSFMKDLVGVL